MRILIATLGSRGDIQPYTALGVGLKQAGHDVTICTSWNFSSFITDSGLNYAYMNDELIKLVDTPDIKELIDNGTGILRILKKYHKMAKLTAPMQRQTLAENWQAVQDTKPDCIIYHPKAFGCPHFAEKIGIPAIMAPLQPVMVPSETYPNMLFPQWNLGGWYNRFSHQCILGMMWFAFGKYINEWRKDNQLPPVHGRKNILYDAKGKHIPVMHGYSRNIVPIPEDWPQCSVATGYWFLDQTNQWQPENKLLEFLKAGPVPVYVGFGSMAGRNPKRLTGIILDALQIAGVRAVIATGWGGLSSDDIPETVFKIDSAPHEWLFPRMAAVVHHGGAGTTAAGLRAGRPSVICPFIADQPMWGKRVYELKVGPKPIPGKKLTANKLAAAIKEAVSNQQMQRNAQAIGEQLCAEDGIANALSFIERVVSNK